jgi:hypothetical protein
VDVGCWVVVSDDVVGWLVVDRLLPPFLRDELPDGVGDSLALREVGHWCLSIVLFEKGPSLNRNLMAI